MSKLARNLVSFGGFCAVILAVNFIWPQVDVLRVFVAVFTLLYFGYELGAKLASERHWSSSMPLGIILTLSIQSVTQTAAYYLAPSLGFWSDALGLIAVAVTGTIIRLAFGDNEEKPRLELPKTWLEWVSACLTLGAGMTLTALALGHANDVATTAAIRTPWPLLGWKTLMVIAALWLGLYITIRLSRGLASQLSAMLALGATTLLAPLVYAVGFGFDGFLHVASEKILLMSGTLTPKPLYYIGQYVFTTWLSRSFDLPLAAIDRWLVPIGAALLIPLALLHADKPHSSPTRFLLLGLLPLAPFVATTPQSLAYILGLAAVLLAWGATKNATHPLASLILCAWAVAVHPLAGLPLLFACLAALSLQSAGRVTAWIFIILAGAILPVSFWILGLRGGTEIVWKPEALLEAQNWLNWLKDFLPWIGNHYVLWPAWASLVNHSLAALFLILTVIGLITSKEERRYVALWLGAAVLFWLGAAILNISGDFSFLIDYERSNFANRLNTLALLCLFPAAMPAWRIFWERLAQAPRMTQFAAVTLFVAMSTGLAYTALPRHDALITGRGWSTSQSDIAAVTLINRDAGDKPYVVLANQSVSAAAVATLGFKRYAGDIFFYPIPTGGPLYQVYLDMTYGTPSLEQARKAAALGQAELVYVVINDYWWRAEGLIEALKPMSEQTWMLDGGAVTIFKIKL